MLLGFCYLIKAKLYVFIVQAVKDIDKLLVERDKALKDPLAFVKRLQGGEKLDLPISQKIPTMPIINWDKYNLASLPQNKPETRGSKFSNGKL